MSGVRRESRQGEGMKRLLRITLNALTVLSLLLCVATAVVWVRSYIGGDLIYHADGTEVEFLSRSGKLAVTVTHFDGWHDAPPRYGWRRNAKGSGYWLNEAAREIHHFDRLGFTWET